MSLSNNPEGWGIIFSGIIILVISLFSVPQYGGLTSLFIFLIGLFLIVYGYYYRCPPRDYSISIMRHRNWITVIIAILVFIPYFILFYLKYGELDTTKLSLREQLISFAHVISLLFFTAFLSGMIKHYKEMKTKEKGLLFLILITTVGLIGAVFLFPLINILAILTFFAIYERYPKQVPKKYSDFAVIDLVLFYFVSFFGSIALFILDIWTFLLKPEFNLTIILTLVFIVTQIYKRKKKH